MFLDPPRRAFVVQKCEEITRGRPKRIQKARKGNPKMDAKNNAETAKIDFCNSNLILESISLIVQFSFILHFLLWTIILILFDWTSLDKNRTVILIESLPLDTSLYQSVIIIPPE